eukprot:1573807-Alexandrium_andersonii.AAC.1
MQPTMPLQLTAPCGPVPLLSGAPAASAGALSPAGGLGPMGLSIDLEDSSAGIGSGQRAHSASASSAQGTSLAQHDPSHMGSQAPALALLPVQNPEGINALPAGAPGTDAAMLAHPGIPAPVPATHGGGDADAEQLMLIALQEPYQAREENEAR